MVTFGLYYHYFYSRPILERNIYGNLGGYIISTISHLTKFNSVSRVSSFFEVSIYVLITNFSHIFNMTMLTRLSVCLLMKHARHSCMR